MNIRCHFIPHTFHYVSVYFVLKSISLRCCNHCIHTLPTLLAGFSVPALPCFLASLKFVSNCDLEVIDGPWSSGVHFRFEVSPKHIIRGREIRRMCRPWKLVTQWNNVLWKHFPNDLYGHSRLMGSCTIILEPYGQELNSRTVIVWWGSFITFQHNEQMRL